MGVGVNQTLPSTSPALILHGKERGNGQEGADFETNRGVGDPLLTLGNGRMMIGSNGAGLARTHG